MNTNTAAAAKHQRQTVITEERTTILQPRLNEAVRRSATPTLLPHHVCVSSDGREEESTSRGSGSTDRSLRSWPTTGGCGSSSGRRGCRLHACTPRLRAPARRCCRHSRTTGRPPSSCRRLRSHDQRFHVTGSFKTPLIHVYWAKETLIKVYFVMFCHLSHLVFEYSLNPHWVYERLVPRCVPSHFSPFTLNNLKRLQIQLPYNDPLWSLRCRSLCVRVT